MNGACRWKVEDWSLVAHNLRNPNIFPSLYCDSLLCTETHRWFMAQCLLIKNNVFINKKKLNGLYITERKRETSTFEWWISIVTDLKIFTEFWEGLWLSICRQWTALPLSFNPIFIVKRLPKLGSAIFYFSFVFCKRKAK